MPKNELKNEREQLSPTSQRNSTTILGRVIQQRLVSDRVFSKTVASARIAQKTNCLAAISQLSRLPKLIGTSRENAKEEKSTMEIYWVPSVNHLGSYGRWEFAEFTEVYEVESGFEARVEQKFNEMIAAATAGSPTAETHT